MAASDEVYISLPLPLTAPDKEEEEEGRRAMVMFIKQIPISRLLLSFFHEVEGAAAAAEETGGCAPLGNGLRGVYTYVHASIIAKLKTRRRKKTICSCFSSLAELLRRMDEWSRQKAEERASSDDGLINPDDDEEKEAEEDIVLRPL